MGSCVAWVTSGSSAAWLARLVWDQEAAGSNPAFPTRAGPSEVSESARGGGAPGRSRTRNLTGRNRLLYPVELQGREIKSSERLGELWSR